jgi:WD40 repeat protein
MRDALASRARVVTTITLETWNDALGALCLAPTSPGAGARAVANVEVAKPPAPAAALPYRDHVHHLVRLLLPVVEAVHALHQAGIIHRDIKPDNILLTGDGSRAVLMDLGIAQLIDEEENRLTHTREFVGTLQYASPEQVMAVGRLDARSDVYSLGATLWELLAMRHLYGDPQKMSAPELMRKIQFEDPPPLHKVVPGFSRDLSAIVQKCLEKDPGKRYPTAEALAEDLDRFLDHRPVRARPVGTMGRLSRWCRRKPAIAAMLSAIAALALVGLGGVLWQWREATINAAAEKDARDLAERNEKRALASEDDAKQKAKEAGDAKAEMEKKAKQLEWQSYKHRIALAQREWQNNNVGLAEKLLNECDPALRGWEWNYCKRLCHLEKRLFSNCPGVWLGTTFSPDGSRFAVDSEDGHVRIYDAQSGLAIRDISVPPRKSTPGRTVTVAFNADGKQVAVGCWDGAVRLFDVETGKLIHSFQGDGSPAVNVALSPDGKRVAAFIQKYVQWGGDPGLIQIWEIGSTKPALSFSHLTAVQDWMFSPDGRHLVTSGGLWNGWCYVWDAATGKELQTFSGTNVAYAPSGKQIIVGERDGTLKLRDATDWRELWLSRGGHSAPINHALFSRDGKRIASASEDNTIKVWDASNGRELLTIRGHTKRVSRVAFLSDDRDLISASQDNTIRVWNPATSGASVEMEGSLGPVPRTVAFRPDGRILAWGDGNWDQQPTLFSDPETRQVQYKCLLGEYNAFAFSPDGKQLAIAGATTVPEWRRRVVIREARTGKEIQVLQHTAQVLSAAWSPDGRLIATVGEGREVQLWEVHTGEQLFSFPAPLLSPGACPDMVAFSPDSRLLAAPGPDREAKVWDTTTGREVLDLKGHTMDVWAVAFSADGKRLVTGSRDGTARVWDTSTGEQQLVLKGHTSMLFSVAFTPNGKRIVSGSGDKTINLWDAVTGDSVLTLRGHRGWVYRVAVSPDGNKIVSTSSEETAPWLWDGSPLE